MSVKRSAEDIIKIIVPYLDKNRREIPAQIREETIHSIKTSFMHLNSLVHTFDGFGSWRSGGNGNHYEKVTIIESQGKNPFSESGILSISEEMRQEVIILTESRGIRERLGEKESDVKPPNIIEYEDGSKLVIYDYLYIDSDHPEGDPVLLVEHSDSSGAVVERYYYPRHYLKDGLLEAEYMPI